MRPGEIVAGRYRLDEQLGVGGSGEVWRATHVTTGQSLAIKLMHAHAATSANARRRFAREARISAKINHPNVIDVFDAGEHESSLFLVMELLDGISLADAFHLAPPLSAQDFLVVMHDTALALAAAHSVGVVHRDIKPGNIFLHRDPVTGFASAKILDFGISKYASGEDAHNTKMGAVLGSPRYMSPEQARSAANVDHRADLWSCGVILFEGFTGTWPHEGDSFSNLVVAICTVPPISIDRMVPDLPEPVRAIVRDCLNPVTSRIQSAAELASRIADALQDPMLAQRPLARPLNPPSDSIKASTGVRVHPPPGSGIELTDNMPTTPFLPHIDIEGILRSKALPPPPPPDDEDDGADELATTPIPPEVVAAALARLPATHRGTIRLPAGLPNPPPPTFEPQRAREPQPSFGAFNVPRAPVFGAPPPPLAAPRPVPWLRFAVAGLSVLLVAIVVALIKVVFSARR